MRQLIVSFTTAAIAAASPMLALGVSPARADAGALGAAPLALAADAPAAILVSGGCGPYRHRGFNGFCYPGGGFYRPYGGYYRPYGYRPYGYGYGYRRYGYY